MLAMRVVAICSFHLLVSCAYAEQRWTCPEQVLPTKIEVDAKTIGDWQLNSSVTPLWLTNIAVYDGPVAENASLVPDEQVADKQKGSSDVWKFARPYPLGKFIACEYGNGLVKLSQPLAKEIVMCRTKTAKAKQRSGIDAEFMCN